MKGVLAIVFFNILLAVSQASDQRTLSEALEDRLRDFTDAVSYTSCTNSGKCDHLDVVYKETGLGDDADKLGNKHVVNEPADHIVKKPGLEEHVLYDEHVLEEPEPSEDEGTSQDESYCNGQTGSFPHFEFCKRISSRFGELESRHPELKSLKLEFLKTLETRTADLDVNCKDGESVISKLLDLVIAVAEEMKVKFSKHTHEMYEPIEEIIAEDDTIGFVGSIRGIPGINYPNYTEVPITSFSCSDKKYIPGFYADLETGCQVFHVCYEHRRESFLCPIGTIFNQPILACDYWYSANCSLSPSYFDVNKKKDDSKISDDADIRDLITTIIEEEPDLPQVQTKPAEPIIKENVLKDLEKFLPVKAEIIEYPQTPKAKVSTFTKSEVASDIFGVVPKPKKVYVPKKPAVVAPKKVKPLPLVMPKFRVKSFPVPFKKIIPVSPKYVAKTKIAVPVAKKIAVKAVVPVVKTKIAVPVAKKIAVKAAIPVVKTKIAVATVPVAKKIAVKAAVPVVKAKLLKPVPVVKAKTVVPVAKAKFVKAAIPVVKAKKFVPLAAAVGLKPKLAVARIPVVKAKAVKSIAISPLTKKALAFGYMKLLKAKKLALMG